MGFKSLDTWLKSRKMSFYEERGEEAKAKIFFLIQMSCKIGLIFRVKLKLVFEVYLCSILLKKELPIQWFLPLRLKKEFIKTENLYQIYEFIKNKFAN